MKRLIAILAAAMIVCTAQAQLKQISVNITRPAAVTAYTANDCVNDSASTPALLVFKNASKGAHRGGAIVGATLWLDSLNVTNATMRLFIYADSTQSDTTGGSSSPACQVPAYADNAVFLNRDTTRFNLIGYIDFPAPVTGGASAEGSVSQAITTGAFPLYFVTRRDANLYGILVAQAAYVGKRYGRIQISLTIKED